MSKMFDTPSIILHNVNMAQNQKPDQRTIFTISAIKDAFLHLIERSPYSKINVSAICEEAEILFQFILHGTFCVNTLLGWQKDEK